MPAGIVTTTGAGCGGAAARGRSSGIGLVGCDVRVRCGCDVAVLLRSCGGGGSGAVVPAISDSFDGAGGGGACSAVSRLSFFWLEQPAARISSTGTSADMIGLRRLRFMTLLSRTGRRDAVPADV